MMTRQARPSAKIIGFDTHMILEAVPARHSNTGTAIRPSTGHHATMPGPWGALADLSGLPRDKEETRRGVDTGAAHQGPEREKALPAGGTPPRRPRPQA